MSKITIKDIAKICGCGIGTVSRALNNHPNINPETKKRIMDVVEEYNFVPNNTARYLKLTESKTIAVLVKGMTNPMFTGMIKIMEEEIQSCRYSMELRHVYEKNDEIEVALELIRDKKPGGIVFLGGSFEHSVEEMKRLDVPFVLSTIAIADDEKSLCSAVAVDDIAESYRIVDFLCKKGHKKIAILTATETDASIGKLRTEGYRRALSDNNIQIAEKLITGPVNAEDIYSMENGYLSTKKLLESGEEFTAIFAISDTMAIGAYRALHEAGLGVPGDVSVVGFDRIEMGAYCIPALTTVRQPVETMARETIRTLFERLENDAPNRRRIYDAELLVRESVAEIG